MKDGRPEDLVVLSHLRWTWVWQRPQHLVKRLAAGRRTWFVEEPVVADVERPRLCLEQRSPIFRVWLEVPGPEREPGFDDPAAGDYAQALAKLIGPASSRTVWLYTPAALPLADALAPDRLVYDVMDDLAAFKDASPILRAAQDDALARADVVFTGGRSLHEGVRERANGRAHRFASGVEPEHYARAKRLRRPRERPVAGYVGVIDERLDLELIGGLAAALPEWDVEIVGPIAKIDPAELPQAPNLRYPGMQPYEALPRIMGGFDVALMPFALNEATRSISPTKTLEYLAAGLPVVSTRVPDVVADYPGVVDLRDDAAGFATACQEVLAAPPAEREAKVRPLLQLHHWDTIAARMEALMAAPGSLRTEGAPWERHASSSSVPA